MQNTLTILALVTLLAAPALAEPVPEAPSRVTTVTTAQGTVVAWQAIEGEDVLYRVHGRSAGAWEVLIETTDTYAMVPSGFDEYGVSAMVGDQESAIAQPCVSVEPDLEDPVRVHAPCRPLSRNPDGQGL